LRRYLAALLLLPLFLLTACGGKEEPKAAATPSLADIHVSGDVGSKPKVEFATPLKVDKVEHKVLTEGDGAPVEEGQQVKGHLLTLDGTTGSELEDSFGQPAPVGFPMDPQQINPDLYDAVLGVPVGSRVLTVVPAEAADGASVVVVLDVLEAKVVPGRADGEPVKPAPGLPTVKLADNGAPTITLPKADPPKELIVQPLITGKGPKVNQGQTITVHYTGVKWPGGEVFDSSWDKGKTAQFPIGVGNVIPGWDAGLVDQPVGSQVLLVIPPDQGYGKDGQPGAGISGTDTLVFVVDILDAS
jgi:peptidylprolyl isomerase